MGIAEWSTRGTIWVALGLYVGSEFFKGKESWRGARLMDTLGCAAFVAHVASAFDFYHGWSHSAAYLETARQTAAMTGWNSGLGLYVNYAFGLAWIAEVVWKWVDENGYVGRARWLTWAVRSLFAFMILNGAVIFAHGGARVLGVLICLGLAGTWRRAKTRIKL